MLLGMSTTKACEAQGVPLRTFLDWVDASEGNATCYARAREIQVERMADEIRDIADAPIKKMVTMGRGGGMTERLDPADVQHKKLRTDSRKWLLSKVAPKKYGDRLAVEAADGDSLFGLFARAVDAETPSDETDK